MIITAKAVKMVKVDCYTDGMGFNSRTQTYFSGFSPPSFGCLLNILTFYSKQPPKYMHTDFQLQYKLIGKGVHWKFYSHPLSKCLDTPSSVVSETRMWWWQGNQLRSLGIYLNDEVASHWVVNGIRLRLCWLLILWETWSVTLRHAAKLISLDCEVGLIFIFKQTCQIN